ncbi:Dihydroflavonol-4-reductase-like protein [Quillaja saponaria]|uniref:Dihydroflavonol-4-reductase-like protein n=1 Tax=Quillaja saponaria TaxID=32244 RepID=A0AAD7L457_QUISA|nr:Dihydroflavonol-4-reductase-like protein [Quillaja saponaria]
MLEFKDSETSCLHFSSATILYNNKGLTELDESTWIDLENFQRNKIATSSSYLVSKTLTEKVALEFAQKNGLEVVSLVLSLVVGPFICPKVPSSVSDALPMIGDERQYENNSNFWLVHIDDVTRALIYLLHYPDAEGRYICSSTHITVSQFHEFLHARYPEFQIIMPIGLKETKRVTISSKKLLETGFKYKYGLNEMFDGAIQSCRDKGFL